LSVVDKPNTILNSLVKDLKTSLLSSFWKHLLTKKVNVHKNSC